MVVKKVKHLHIELLHEGQVSIRYVYIIIEVCCYDCGLLL